jgi:two-component system LytT family sensor kinase
MQETIPHPKLTARALALWLGGVVLLGLLLFAYRYLEVLASRGTESPLYPLLGELTGAFAAGLMFFPARWLVRRLPLTRSTWPRRLPAYLLMMLVLAPAVTTLIWGLRIVVFPLAGLGPYDYGVMPLRYFMELPIQAVAFTLTVSGIHAWDALEAARRRELRAAQLEGSLARAQLRNLRLQLQPHFLFNALNTISETMYDDQAAADEMLGGLADLLRSSLRTAQSDEVPLEEELALLDRYLHLMRARFGERLAVSIEIDPRAVDALVPSLILQPLVENAIRHGNAERSGTGTIAVRARAEGARLILEVEDDGPGDARRNGHKTDSGVGLAATAERLQILYGAAQTFSAGDGTAGAFLARATLPLRRAAA